MTRQLNTVSLAPIAAGVGKGGGKALGNVVVVVVAGQGDLAVRQIPQKLGEVLHKGIAVGGGEGLLQIVRPRQVNGLTAVGKGQRALTHELRLIGEDGRDGTTELVAYGGEILFVGHLDEFLDGLGVQGVYVGFVVVPRALARQLTPDVPDRTLGVVDGLLLGQLAIGLQALVLSQHHVKAGKEQGSGSRGVIRVTGEGEVALTESVVLGDVAAAKARGPFVLVVEPRQHIILLGMVGAGLDQTHEAVGEVGGGHTVAAVHMEAAQPHFLENVDLTAQLIRLQVAVPRPEGSAAVLGGGVLEQLLVQSRGVSVLIVDHVSSSSASWGGTYGFPRGGMPSL